MWDMLLNEEQTAIADSVREYLTRELPLDRLRPNAAPRDGARAQAEMAQLGWIGAGLPESVGGSGLGLVEEILIQRECARNLVSPSALASVLAAHVASGAGDNAMASGLVGGEISAALAIPRPPTLGDSQIGIHAFDWNGSDPLLIWNQDGMGLFAPEAVVEASLHPGLDDSVVMHSGKLRLDRPTHWVGVSQAPIGVRAQVLLAARLTGLADHACELTVEYAKTREQFGKPIGSFQAVKHRCADMALRARLSWLQTQLACLKVQYAASDAALQAASAKLLAAQAAHENARAAIQMHGAIGFQSECDVHWFMKRAHLYDQAGGNARAQANLVLAEASPLW